MGISIAERTEFVDRSLGNFRDVLERMPPDFCWLPGYRAQAMSVLERLAVPKLVELPDGNLRASMPADQHFSKDSLWVVALLPEETVAFDGAMASMTLSQRAHIAEYLSRNAWKDSEAAVKSAEEIQNLLTKDNVALNVTIGNREAAGVRWDGVSVPQKYFMEQSLGMVAIGRPVLILNADERPRRVHPALLAHDIQHMIDWLGRGIVPSIKTSQGINLHVRLELRGNHAGYDLGTVLRARGYDASADSDSQAGLTERIEELRKNVCSPHDPFRVDRHVRKVFERTGGSVALALGLEPRNHRTIPNRLRMLVKRQG